MSLTSANFHDGPCLGDEFVNRIDDVVVFATKDLDKVIGAIRPDVLTKGSDYEPAEILGRKIVEGYGGRVERIPIAEEISTTQIINSIQKKGDI